MVTPIILSTGIIDNRAPFLDAGRPARSLVVRVENNAVTSATIEGNPIVLIEVFNGSPPGSGFGNQSTYALNQVSLNDVNQPGSMWTIDNVPADVDLYGVRCTITATGSSLPFLPTVTVFSKDAQGNIISSHRLYLVTVATATFLPTYGYVFNTGAQTVPVGEDVTFGTNGPLAGVTHTAGMAAITVSTAGTYSTITSVTTTEPLMAFGVTVNNFLQSSTVYGQAGPNPSPVPVTGSTILTLAAGDVLTLRNSGTTINQVLSTTGDGTPIVNASFHITRIA